MDLNKQYEDSEGNKCNILTLVKKEPEWAANVIQWYEKKLSTTTALNTEYTKCPYEGMTTEECHAYNNGECMHAFVCKR